MESIVREYYSRYRPIATSSRANSVFPRRASTHLYLSASRRPGYARLCRTTRLEQCVEIPKKVTLTHFGERRRGSRRGTKLRSRGRKTRTLNAVQPKGGYARRRSGSQPLAHLPRSPI